VSSSQTPAGPDGQPPVARYTAIFVSRVVAPHVVTSTCRLLVAVQVYQRSFAMPVAPPRLHAASFCPSAPVVAVELSNGNEPRPEMTKGVAQSSLLCAKAQVARADENKKTRNAWGMRCMGSELRGTTEERYGGRALNRAPIPEYFDTRAFRCAVRVPR
jgi:hypothetical protein